MAEPLITEELATKLKRFFADLGLQVPDAQHVAWTLRERGIVVVDATRNTFQIDVRVHEGALYRSGLLRQRVDQLEAFAAHVSPAPAIWRWLSAQQASQDLPT